MGLSSAIAQTTQTSLKKNGILAAFRARNQAQQSGLSNRVGLGAFAVQ